MKKIINPWVGLEGYNCVGCCPTNPLGLRLELFEDGDDIVSEWHPGQNYQGWIDTLHGGVISTLLDEVAGWVVFRKLQSSGFTVRLNVKFRKQVLTTEDKVTVRGRLVEMKRNYATIHCELTNTKGELCDEAEAIYCVLPQDENNKMHFHRCRVEGEE